MSNDGKAQGIFLWLLLSYTFKIGHHELKFVEARDNTCCKCPASDAVKVNSNWQYMLLNKKTLAQDIKTTFMTDCKSG